MYLSELIKKEKKELNKISKDEIIKTIVDSKWQWEHKESQIKELDAKLVKQSENERAAKMMLVGYLGKQVERDEYDNSVIGLDKTSLLELLGELMVKASRY
jgi:hypothetical protein